MDAGGLPKFGGYYNNPQNGRPVPVFDLPKDLTITLVAGYSAPLRHRIVTRWLELESRAPAIPKSFSAALRLAAETQERLEAARRNRHLSP